MTAAEMPLESSDAAPRRSVQSRASLRRKGFWTVIVLCAYFILVTGIIAVERNIMIESVSQLQEVNEREERLIAINVAVSRTILAINENYFSPEIADAAKVLILEVEAILPGLRRLESAYPILQPEIASLDHALAELAATPTRATIADLRSTVHRMVIELDVITADVHALKQRTLERYRTTFNRVTLEWALFGVVGIAVMGGVILIFFRRLARDIDWVRERGSAIVRGYRGSPLDHSREDELGALMDAVNEMQQELRQREAHIEMGRQQQFHKEKMAAVGSLAAAVAHEINNPMAAIVGIAQAMDSECRDKDCTRYGQACHPNLLLEQATRVQQITRRISEFSVPQSQGPDLLDINGLLRSTCNFLKFDRRFRLMEVDLNLDVNLPAVVGVADHLVQVAMNLLINAADAVQDQIDPAPHLEVMTRAEAGSVLIEVRDNGCGIAPEHLDRVFDEHFTTKGAGHGSGLGLALCRSLIREAGGDIAIASALGAGTIVSVRLQNTTMGSENASAKERG